MSAAQVFSAALDAMLCGPMGTCVTHGSTQTRGILTREWREDEDDVGMRTTVHVTTLTLRDGTLSGAIEREVIAVDGKEYVIRRVLPVDDMGAREMIIAERSR